MDDIFKKYQSQFEHNTNGEIFRELRKLYKTMGTPFNGWDIEMTLTKNYENLKFNMVRDKYTKRIVITMTVVDDNEYLQEITADDR